MRSVVILAIAATIAGCSASKEPAEVSLSWSDGPEASKVATSGTDSSKSLLRCWPVEGRYDCLSASGGGDSLYVHRLVSKNLPGSMPPTPALGYRCVLGSGYVRFTEEIDGPAGKQVERVMPQGGKWANGPAPAPWTRAYIDGYMKDNKINPGGRYLNCELIAQAYFTAFAIGNLASTSVGYSALTN